MAVPNIGKLHKQNQGYIFPFIDSLSVNSAAERGRLRKWSLIEGYFVLYNWAGDVVVRINKSFIQKGSILKVSRECSSLKYLTQRVLKMLTLTPATRIVRHGIGLNMAEKWQTSPYCTVRKMDYLSGHRCENRARMATYQ